MFQRTINVTKSGTLFHHFWLGLVMSGFFITTGVAQYRDLYLHIKPGYRNGYGDDTSQIKVRMLLIDETGATDKLEFWLREAWRGRDGVVIAPLSPSYNFRRGFWVKTLRLENHRAATFGSRDWWCDGVCLSSDGRICRETIGIDFPIKAGEGVEAALERDDSSISPRFHLGAFRSVSLRPFSEPNTPLGADPDSRLWQAIRDGNKLALKAAIQSGANVNGKNEVGETPLMGAIQHRTKADVLTETLLENHANPNLADARGLTPIHYAARAQNASLLLLLFDGGGDVRVAVAELVRAGDEQTFLQIAERREVRLTNEQFRTALRNKNYGIAEIGIGRGVDPNYALDQSLRSHVRQLIEPALQVGADADPVLKYAMEQRDLGLARKVLLQYRANTDLALQLAVQYADLTILQLALQKGANANKVLPQAARLGDFAIVEALLEGRADPNVGLIPAVQAERTRIVDLLLQRGAKPTPALPAAVERNNTNLVAMLLRAGAEVRDPQLLALAASKRNLDIVKMLRDKGIDANAGMSAAIDANSLEIVRYLLENKADGKDVRLIGRAAQNGNQGIVALLLEYGANPTNGLFGAVGGGQVALAEYLLKNKANGTDPRLIAYAAGNGNEQMTALLLSAGAKAEAGMKAGVESGSAAVVGLLLKNGASAKPPEYILAACRARRADLARVLLHNGAPKNVFDESEQPLIHIALLTWDVNLVSVLLENGVDPNAINRVGDTALHIVARDTASAGYPAFEKKKKTRIQMIEALLEGGAEVHMANKQGEWILAVADGRDVKKLLEEAAKRKQEAAKRKR